MTVWVEQPTDGGSAVWGCDACSRGAWCWDHTTAQMEARTHATSHGQKTVNTVGHRHGPKPTNDPDVRRLRDQGHSIRSIAATVHMSTAGVIKSLTRTTTGVPDD